MPNINDSQTSVVKTHKWKVGINFTIAHDKQEDTQNRKSLAYAVIRILEFKLHDS
jgi:hypothetical protein